jgi:hypothetical protein
VLVKTGAYSIEFVSLMLVILRNLVFKLGVLDFEILYWKSHSDLKTISAMGSQNKISGSGATSYLTYRDVLMPHFEGQTSEWHYKEN